jgi:hypothetical protein
MVHIPRKPTRPVAPEVVRELASRLNSLQPRRGALFGAGCSSSSYEIKPAFTSSGKGTTDHINTYNAASAVIVDQNQTA